jgi:hypothetical protein
MSLLHYNPDTECSKCGTTYDSFSDLQCPKCLDEELKKKMKEKESLVETDINKRWEKGMPHHYQSERLYKLISDLDLKYGNDYFCFKNGGVGDNGEHLMYLLDIHFELQEL